MLSHVRCCDAADALVCNRLTSFYAPNYTVLVASRLTTVLCAVCRFEQDIETVASEIDAKLSHPVPGTNQRSCTSFSNQSTA